MPRGVRETGYFIVSAHPSGTLTYKEIKTAAAFREWLTRSRVTISKSAANAKQGIGALPDGRSVLILRGKLIRLTATIQPVTR